ncbi:MAG: Hsp20/alpha crystallin family protein [Bdellovibrionales bacterium]|nr:Hsp20/alpha crystallin family protein [Bdellovibrionales bacterium]
MKKLRELVPWKHSSEKAPSKQPNWPGSLQREMNRLFDDFFTGFGIEPFAGMSEKGFGFNPNVNVEENEKEIVVTAEVPGMNQDDIHLSLTDEQLVLSGERKNKTERKENGVTYYESSYGNFKRVIPIGVEIDHDKVDACLEKGQLVITLPKTEISKQQSKKISIR